jgi:hypothetical protein
MGGSESGLRGSCSCCWLRTPWPLFMTAMRYPHPCVRISHHLPSRLVGRRSGRRLVWPADESIVLRQGLAGAVDRSIAKRDGAVLSRTLSRTGIEGRGGWCVRALIALSGPGCANWECGRYGEQQDRYMGEFHGWFFPLPRCETRDASLILHFGCHPAFVRFSGASPLSAAGAVVARQWVGAAAASRFRPKI